MLQCNMADDPAGSTASERSTIMAHLRFPGVELIEERAEQAWRLPMGVASPLWAVFGAAAGVGVAYWWMTHWTKIVNVEALAGAAMPAESAPATLAVAAVEVVEVAVEAAPAVVEAALEPAAELEIAPEPEIASAPDDLTRLTGIGPKLSVALAERGVTRFAQIAAWTADDLAEFDAALSLKGRAIREAWVAQAKRLADA
jgi:predicted flap endonuclease-1-like 5' DNA nuclease